jgi:serpin B
MFISAIAISLAIISCTGNPGGKPVNKPPSANPPAHDTSGQVPVVDAAAPITDAATTDQLVNGNTQFAWDLYKRISEGNGNLFYSPYSISVALAMTYAGAGGVTETEMGKVLHFDLPQQDLHPAFKELNDKIMSRGKNAEGTNGTPFKLNVANSLWAQKDFPFVRHYLFYTDYYRAGLNFVDYKANPESARLEINKWVADNTENKIQDLIPQGVIDNLTRLVLANAIYFNAAWATAFEEGATRDEDFHLLDGTTKKVAMMNQSESHGYESGPGWQAVDLSYSGNEISMMVIVPDQGKFADIEKSLDSTALQATFQALRPQEVVLGFPKFKVEQKIMLADTLKAMGMPSAFNDTADFSGMYGAGSPEKLCISDVIHQAYVKVNEAGTEAAAATAVVMKATMAPASPVELTIDRPFIFVIRDIETGTVLFIGRVTDPGE